MLKLRIPYILYQSEVTSNVNFANANLGQEERYVVEEGLHEHTLW